MKRRRSSPVVGRPTRRSQHDGGSLTLPRSGRDRSVTTAGHGSGPVETRFKGMALSSSQGLAEPDPPWSAFRLFCCRGAKSRSWLSKSTIRCHRGSGFWLWQLECWTSSYGLRTGAVLVGRTSTFISDVCRLGLSCMVGIPPELAALQPMVLLERKTEKAAFLAFICQGDIQPVGLGLRTCRHFALPPTA